MSLGFSAGIAASVTASVSAGASFNAAAGVSAKGEGAINGQEDPHPVYRFYVAVDGVHQAIFTEISGLQAELEVTTLESGGDNTNAHSLPGRFKRGTLQLKRGFSSSKELMQWFFNVMAGKVERRNLSVLLYNKVGKVVAQWDYLSAFPFKWSCNTFRADSTEFAIESVDIAYSAVRVDGVALGGGASAGASVTASASAGFSVNASASASAGFSL